MALMIEFYLSTKVCSKKIKRGYILSWCIFLETEPPMPGYPAILERLPEELIIYIIDYICEMIVQDLTRIRFEPHVEFGREPNQFKDIRLVCKTFYRIIHNTVLVDGLPIRPRLLCLQMDRLKHVPQGCFSCCHRRRGYEDETNQTIERICGRI